MDNPISIQREALDDTAADEGGSESPTPNHRRKRAERHSLLIRTAKLVSPHGEFVCVIRDVSETGVCLRLFHGAPTGEPIELHMTGDRSFEIRQIWHEGNEVGYEFAQPINLAEVTEEASEFPKRGLRLNLLFPVKVNTLEGMSEGIIDNLSQQGARFSCEGLYAIDQSLHVDCPEKEISFGEVNAKVRWRRDSEYGVVFENTLSLEEFARLAARVQCPDLLRSGPPKDILEEFR